MSEILGRFGAALAAGAIRVVDLTHALSEDFPTLVLPEPYGQAHTGCQFEKAGHRAVNRPGRGRLSPLNRPWIYPIRP